jgi:hypothetical protein
VGQLLSTHLCHLDVSIHSIFSIVIELEQFNAVGIFGPDESFSHRIGENKANDVGFSTTEMACKASWLTLAMPDPTMVN